MNVKPLNSNILTKRQVIERSVSPSGFITNDKPEVTKNLEVVAIGPDVKDTKVGEVLLTVPNTAYLVEHEGTDYYMVDESNIMAKVA